MNRGGGGGHRGNYGAARDGFGAGRHGRGGGRTGGRNFTWNRIEEPPREIDKAEEEQVQKEDEEKHMGGKTPEDQRGGPVNPAAGAPDAPQGNNAARNPEGRGAQAVKIPCDICGLFNHATRECRRLTCEICGVQGHMAYDCKKCIPWNSVPELCATQVEDQSFFFIEESIDPRMTRERDSTAVISIVSGQASGRDVERQFMNIHGAAAWKWIARPAGENKYTMRFPNSQMVKEWSFFPAVSMRFVDAQMKIEPYTSSFGAKGVLQQAWFRVRGIPIEQRSIKTCAQVGGLVGRSVEIDEKTRLRNDFVRIKIACRDVHKVPPTAESTLGMVLHDFSYEREVDADTTVRTLQSGIKINESNNQPPPKKLKPDNSSGKQSKTNAEVGGKGGGYVTGNKSQRNLQSKINSAPPKFGERKINKELGKEAMDSEIEGKVYIPEKFDDLDSDSDIDEGVQRALQFDEPGQGCSKDRGDFDAKHAWHMETVIPTVNLKQFPMELDSLSAKEQCNLEGAQITDQAVNDSQAEIDMSEEAIVQTQESVEAEEKQEKEEEPEKIAEECKQQKKSTRRSNRLVKDIALTTGERNERMAKKRNFEGLYAEVDKQMMINGVATMLKVAAEILLPQQQQGGARRELPGNGVQDQEEM